MWSCRDEGDGAPTVRLDLVRLEKIDVVPYGSDGCNTENLSSNGLPRDYSTNLI